MELTGAGLVWLLAVLVIAVFVSLVLGVPRTQSTKRQGAVRAGQAVGLNVLVLALCAVLLNNANGFFLSWSDLFGAQSPASSGSAGRETTQVTLTKASNSQAAALRAKGAQVKSKEVTDGQESARLKKFTVSGPSGVSGDVWVLVPKGYHRKPKDDYPVILALHGSPGGPGAWLGPMAYGAALDRAVARGEMAPSLLVMPQVNFPYSTDSECVNDPKGGPQVETWLSNDVSGWVARTFPVQTDKSGWAVAGYSAGGWCAAMMAMHHPDQFGAGLVYGGYFRPDFSGSYKPLDAKALSSPTYDLVRAAAHHPPSTNLWVMTSKGDSLSYPSTAALLKAARSPLSVTSYVLRSGGHRFSLWVDSEPASLRWLSGVLGGFAPRSSEGR